MRYLLIGIFLLLLEGMLMAQEVRPAHIQGKITDFKGGNVILFNYETRERDTISVDENGCFDHTIFQDKLTHMSLFFDAYGCDANLFIENGMEADLGISFTKEETYGMILDRVVLDYQGDNADCTKFYDDYDKWCYRESPWPFTRIDTLTFAEYREAYLEDMDVQRGRLMRVKSLAFRQMMSEVLKKDVWDDLFRYAWSKPKKDADFEHWVESFDRNDLANMELSSQYVRWYEIWHPQPEGESYAIYHLKNLKKIFANQEVINAFADSYVEEYLKQAREDIDEVYALYKTISTNKEALAAAEVLYARYSALLPGDEALDFEMTDRKGKVFHLSDFRGKAVYIDVWATWCGPCCAEIPHMEKLAAHYAKDKRIELISISLDEDKAKWEKKLAEDKPEWKQYICPDAFESELCRNYDINAIPRFLFFDKDGKVISLDAPRPSYENTIEYIDKHLAD